MFVGGLLELALPTSVWLVVLLAILCVLAFRRRDSRWARFRYPLLALLMWSDCMSTPALANALIASLEAGHPPTVESALPAPALIVVLSSGYTVRNGSRWEARLDQAGWERTYAGIGAWREHGGRLLFVGEPTPDGTSSLAAVMAAVAASAGVPPSAVQVETQSRTTYENLAFSRALIAAHGDEVWLVTSAMHMRRALAVAHKLGLRLRPRPCDYRALPSLHWYAWLPNSGGAALFADGLHESIGLLYYRLKGYAD